MESGNGTMAIMTDTNAAVVAELRANGGQVAAPYPDPDQSPPPMVLLHTIGARGAKAHLVPMRAQVDGDRLCVCASAHGSPRHPDWYHNLVAHPEIELDLGAETIPVRATEVGGDDREAVFARQAARFPIFA